ncbi:response regulator transcription factor [Leptospira sp. 201903070]|uniref:Response regulator transcription factor n=1 Tax=Leptospira ainlahdjerensis TaxID=2810033 RepID=A0ABS2UB77_9LEPT|nr:response regulator transcription factor [Leptospira ainlahdjerensis]MBM9577612.1 response regulator transcription factor [Leptospira ainlahdjerensis]
MEVISLFPITAMLANLAAFFAILRDRDPFAVYFRVFLLVLAGGNFSIFFLLKASSSEKAFIYFHIFRHFIFFVPYLLLSLSRILSGRPVRSAMTYIVLTSTIALLILIEFDFFADKSVLIREWKLYEWGWFPVLEIPARILVGGFFGICFLISLILLLKPKETLLKGWIPVFVVFWWLGLGTNFIPLFGINFLPLGMSADSIISVFVSVYLSREEADSVFHRMAEGFVCLSVALGLSSLSILYLTRIESTRIQTVLLSLIGATTSWIILRFFRPSKIKSEPLDLKSLSEKGLTKQELRICELISEGYTRKQIGFFLGIADGTLRNHLVHLYDKTVDKEKESNFGKDKFQRLTVFLQKFRKP